MTGIRFRRGNKINLPILAPSGMPLWCEDSKEFYIGTGDNIQKIGGSVEYQQLFNANGYIKLPNGLIIQWGTRTLSNRSEGVTITDTLPIVFPNAGLLPIVCGTTITSGVDVCQVVGLSTTQIKYRWESSNAGSVGASGSDAYWLAIGY